MKKFFRFLMMALMVSMTCLLASCSDGGGDGDGDDYASKVTGTYVGTMRFTISDQDVFTPEKGAKMMIQRSSNEFVMVTFYYADGENVFGDDGHAVYQVEKLGDVYILESDESTIDEIRIVKKNAVATGYIVITDYDGSRYEVDFSFEGSLQK